MFILFPVDIEYFDFCCPFAPSPLPTFQRYYEQPRLLMQLRYYQPRGVSTCAFLLTFATKVPAVPQKSPCHIHAASTPNEVYSGLWTPSRLNHNHGLIGYFPHRLVPYDASNSGSLSFISITYTSQGSGPCFNNRSIPKLLT